MSPKVREQLKAYIRELIQQEIEEASTTATAGAMHYSTPYAFSGKGKKDRRKKIAKQSGYTMEAKFAVKFNIGEKGETATIIVDAGSKGAAEMMVAKNLKKGRKGIASVKRVEPGKAKQVDKRLENVNEVTDREVLAVGKLLRDLSKIQRNYFNIAKIGDKELKDKKYNVYYKGILQLKEKMKDLQDILYRKRQGLENVNEGKYHDWRNDETLSPKQKIGKSMMEVRDTLRELEKMVKMNVRLKNELNVDSRGYWKRTHSALQKISERLVKLANKVGQLK